jgi:hypothetical protein
MMMHDAMMTHKNKRTNNSKKGIFLGRYTCAQEIADQKDILIIFTNFYGAAQKSVSGQQLPQILPSSN